MPFMPSVEATLLDISEKVFTAIQHKDVNALAPFIADDFVQRSSDGSEAGRDAFLQGIATMPAAVTAIRGEQLRVNVYGEVAVVTGVQRAEWRQGNEAGVSAVAFVDVFALRNGTWRIVLAYGVDLPR